MAELGLEPRGFWLKKPVLFELSSAQCSVAKDHQQHTYVSTSWVQWSFATQELTCGECRGSLQKVLERTDSIGAVLGDLKAVLV